MYDPHLDLCHAEHARSPALTCGTCGGPAQGNYSDDAGEVCDTCIANDGAPPCSPGSGA
jgi:hypothetical protein